MSCERIGCKWTLFLDFHSGCVGSPRLVVFWVPSCNWFFNLCPKKNILKCYLNFGLHIRKNNILIKKIQSWLVSKKLSIECKYPSVSHISPNVEDDSPIHCLYFKSQRETRTRASRVFKFNLLRKWLLIAFLFGKFSLTNSYTWWNGYNFLPKLHKFRPICVFFPNCYHLCAKPQVSFCSHTHAKVFL